METNFAENQEKWDRGEVSLRDCYRKGQEHRAYNFSGVWRLRRGVWGCGLGEIFTDQQDDAYQAGFKGENLTFSDDGNTIIHEHHHSNKSPR